MQEGDVLDLFGKELEKIPDDWNRPDEHMGDSADSRRSHEGIDKVNFN